ncbi:rRNA maturation RNase YbeY [Lachnospiraceae bacterium ZAX-1]
MTVYFNSEYNGQKPEERFEFDGEALAKKIVATVVEAEQFPYEAEVSILLVSVEGIKHINQEYRQIDMPTDVLSFPLISYETAGDYTKILQVDTNFNPDTGEVMLGDIILCVPKLKEQACSYGHSEQREFAFLILHSMLHLFGYDHMTKGEAAVMEDKQNRILEQLNILRESKSWNR